MFAEYRRIEDNKKELSKAQRDIVARARTEFNVSSAVFKHETRLQKMDEDVRAGFEHGHADLKGMLGIQLVLALDAPLGEDEDEQEDTDNGGDSYHSDTDDERYSAGGVH
jgi:hypothetical protein